MAETLFSTSSLVKPPAPTRPQGSAPGNPATSYEESLLEARLNPNDASYVGRKYSPLYKGLQDQLRLKLAGIGRVKVNDDGSITYDQNGPLGERERQSVMGQRAQANQGGMLYSSFTDQSIGAALGAITDQAKANIGQYATDIARVMNDESTDYFNTSLRLGSLYGQDVDWMRQPAQVPATPNQPPPTMAQVAQTITPEQRDAAVDSGAFQDPNSPYYYSEGSGVLPPAPAPAPAPAPTPAPPTQGSPQWVGRSEPNLYSLSQQWGVPVNALVVTRAGDGRYVVRVRGGSY